MQLPAKGLHYGLCSSDPASAKRIVLLKGRYGTRHQGVSYKHIRFSIFTGLNKEKETNQTIRYQSCCIQYMLPT